MMAKLTNTESRRLYSWWWDSHISPKNSKWLQENLTDMDTKVKTMIKLIEEDADSFARRAEMYYKKRPELMKLVEEFYRAYRALAERYDHATGALRQAQRTLAEAFPNQIPPMLSDEPPSPSTESASHSRTIFDADDSLKPHNNRMNRPYSEEHDASPSKTGLKQVNEKFGNEEKPPHAKISKGRSMRGLNFQHEGNSSSLVCAENTEVQVQSLKETISKSEFEKEAALLQHRIALENISNMETEIFRSQQELKKLDDEMLMSASNLKISKERCLLLEKTNQSLQSELDALKQRAKEQSVELKNKQEESRLLALDVESGVVKLKDMELSKMGLEEEMLHLKEENGSLNEQVLSSALKIISLQNEIILMKDSIAKLEYEVGLHEEEKRALQQEIANTKKDKVELEQRHHLLMEQIGTVTRNLESLQIMAEELRNRNMELKKLCKKHEEEKNVHLESLKLMETISETNIVLENSLSDANAEIEGSREKIKMLEYSFGSLNGMISVHLSEKVLLVSQVEFITKEMEKLSKNSTLLENSLSDVNAELDSLRVNSKDLEASCQSLFAQNYTLLSEKDTLVSQVERAIRNLETLETRYSVLEHKYLNLENEKELALDEIMELEDSFKREKGEYETLIMSIMLSSNSQVSSFENKIHVLQEKAQLREKELDAEQQNIVNVEIENFIFQRCLHDISDKNSVLSIACQWHLQALKCTEKLISELRQELVVQGNKLASSLEVNEKLRKGIVLMSRELNIVNKDFSSLDGVEDESILEPVLHEIRELVNSILHTQNESQHLHLENSIIMTILTQCGLQAIELRNEKDALERESKIKTKGLSVLQSKELELLELNEKLKMELQGGNQRQEVLKAEMAVLNAKLTDSQYANCTLETEIRKILEEKYTLSKLFYELKERNETVEEENSVVLAELMTMECLYLIFKNSNEEKASELQFSRNHLARLQEDKNVLYQEIGQAIEKLVAAEVENINLKETVVGLQGFSMILENDLNTTRNAFEQSKLEIESSKYVLAQKDGELLQTDQKLKSMQEGNTLLHTRLEGLQLDLNNIMVVREELENKFIILLEGNAERDYEITGLRQDNGMMDKELNQLREEVEDLKTKEGYLNYEIKNQIDEVKSCEVEITTLLNDVHITKVNAEIFEEKVLELLMTREISTMVQREALHEQITLRNADINQLKEKLVSMEGETGVLKEEMNAYMLPITALSDDIASLEEHTLLLANHHTPNHPEKHENLMMFRHHSSSSQEPSDNHTAIATARHVELLKLREKVKSLDKLVVNTGNLIEQERFESNANLEAAMREIEALKSEVNSTESKDITKVNYEQMMKDIQLDRCSNNDVHEPRSISNAGTDDQMSGSWETTERDLDRPIEKGSPVTTVHEIEYHQIPIESTTEKEVAIDKLQLPQRSAESHQEWNKRVIERLSSDAERLSLLQTALEELKRDMETSEMNRSPKSVEFDRVKAQLKESEGVVSQLIGTNRDLVRKAEELHNASSDSRVLGASEMQRGNWRTVSEKAQRGSETIGRLELDLQKIEYILLKLKEEHENNRRIAAGRRRVLLEDYLYGRMDGKRQKKRRSCCLRPKTKDD